MKKTEFFLEFSKALKSKDNVAILDLMIRDPYNARVCYYENKSIKTDYAVWKKDNIFICRTLTGNNPNEDISIAHSVFREIITNRSFNNGVFEKDAHHHVDIFSQLRNFIQTKNRGEYGLKDFIEDRQHYTQSNQPTVNCVDIFTKNDKMPLNFDQEKVAKPKFNIVVFETLKPINLEQIAQVEKAFYANEKDIIAMQEMAMKPLARLHKRFIENPENANVDWSSPNPKFNHRNQEKNELDFGLYNFKRKKLVDY